MENRLKIGSLVKFKEDLFGGHPDLTYFEKSHIFKVEQLRSNGDENLAVLLSSGKDGKKYHPVVFKKRLEVVIIKDYDPSQQPFDEGDI